MPDINKAIAFARECLKWERPVLFQGQIIGYLDGLAYYSFSPESVYETQALLERFLAKRFFIQINRGTSSLFKWSVIVGLQDRMNGPAMFDHGRGESDDMLDAVFDACVAAARLYPKA